MPNLKILQYPDIGLRRKSHKVTNIHSKRIKKIIKDMLATLKSTNNCAALAATQLDIDNPPSVIVVNSIDEDDSNQFCLINPKIISKKGKSIEEEGCMSILPDILKAEIPRASEIEVKSMDIYGNEIKFIVKDFMARCLQHECDHLKGILYIDYLSKSKRLEFEKIIAEENNRCIKP